MSETTSPRSVAAEMKEAAGPYLEEFDRWSSNGASDDPAWLRERRHGAISRFAEVGFPTTREEQWRFTDMKPIARTAFGRADAPQGDDVTSLETRLLMDGFEQHRAVFVNGHFAPSLSSLRDLPVGVQLGSLREALAQNADVVQEHLARYAADERSPLAALNTAFLADGAFLFVPEHTVLDRPLHFLFLVAPDATRSVVVHPRCLVIADRKSHASVIESYASLADGRYWTNAVTEVVVGEGATLDVYRIQREGRDAYHTAFTHSHQARDSVYSYVTFAFGADLARHDIHATLDGEGADCTLDGLSMLRGRQHADYHTTLEHAQPNCTSWEYFNGVFGGEAHGIFNGRIIVRPGAQKTDSKQTNNNLLLSESARADSQPQLEIYADDVKCTHGATLGPIDDEHMFYLQSRGLSEAEARRMLTYGFGSEILRAVSLEPLRTDLDRMVHGWLAEEETRGS